MESLAVAVPVRAACVSIQARGFHHGAYTTTGANDASTKRPFRSDNTRHHELLGYSLSCFMHMICLVLISKAATIYRVSRRYALLLNAWLSAGI